MTKTHPKSLTFRDFIQRVNPRFRFYRHINKLIEVLQQVADDELHRVMIFMPPRHGKSETVSRLFTAYYLYRHPDRWVGINSYAAELAYTLSRSARDNYTAAGGGLKDDAAAVKHWETGAGGGLWAAGVGGPITGKGFHLGLIDDPIKNAEEAASEAIQQRNEAWYASTFLTREEPGGAIVVIQTRWNERDLAGYILDQEGTEDDDPERWHIVSFEAVKGDAPYKAPGTCTIEHDDRQPGEALCPERYPIEKLHKIERRIGAYYWSALYQQWPVPRQGMMLQRQWYEVVAAAPEGTRVRYWDKAGTQGAGAFTAGVLMSMAGGRFYVEDVIKGQWGSAEREFIIKQTAAIDGPNVSIWVEQEPGSGGKESAESTVQSLAGYRIYAERVTGDKVTRAEPMAAQAMAGNIKLVKGEWNAAYLDELSTFPHGRRKDQVDASSGAFNKLALGQGLVQGYNPLDGHRG